MSGTNLTIFMHARAVKSSYAILPRFSEIRLYKRDEMNPEVTYHFAILIHFRGGFISPIMPGGRTDNHRNSFLLLQLSHNGLLPTIIGPYLAT